MPNKICCKILIVEDNEGDYFLVHSMLLNIFPASKIFLNKTIAEASQTLKEEEFDVVLLDLTLPDSMGMESIVRMVNAAGHTPVIVLTGFSDMDFGINTLSKGVTDYLLKDELNPAMLYKSISYSIERKRVHHKLLESEEKYRALIYLSPIAEWVYEIETDNILLANLAAINKYGYSEEEFLRLKASDLVSSEPLSQEEYDAFAKRRFGVIKHIYKHKTKDGSIIYVNEKSSDIRFEGRKARILLVNDITADLINIQKDIKYNQRLKAAQEIGQLGYWEIDIKTKEMFLSEESYKLLGIPDPDFNLSFPEFYEMVHPDDKAIFDQKVKNALAGIAQYDLEYRVILQNKTVRYMYHRCEIIFDNSGRPIRCEGIIQDISERKNYIIAIENQNARLKDIAWTQSHVVRAPLARLMGLVSLIKNEETRDMIDEEIMGKITESATEVDNIIRDIVKKAEQIEQTNNEFKSTDS